MSVCLRCCCCLFCCLLLGAEDGDLLDHVQSDAQRRQRIEHALGWIREQQQDNGSFAGERHAAAISALVLWAHAGAGITIDDPEHGAPLRRALQFMLTQQSENGYFGEKDGGRLYGHALVTIALASALGTHDEDQLNEQLVAALRGALRVIEEAARVEKPGEHRGGWRYTPGERRSDASVSVWQAQALRAAGQCGLPVSEAVRDEAAAYLLRMCSDDGRVGYERVGEDRPSLRGSMLLALAACGEESAVKTRQVLQRLLAEEPAWRGPWFFLGNASAALALCRYRPEGWRPRLRAMNTILVEQQHEEGWWPKPPGDNEGEYGRIYSTALAVIALSADGFAVPAYQP